MYSTTPPGGGKPTPTPTEVALAAIHKADVHDLVLPLLQEGRSQQDIADALSTDTLKVSRPWVTKFIQRHYRKHERWERAS